MRIALILWMMTGCAVAQVTCRSCKSQGNHPCKNHGKAPELAREQLDAGTIHCSVTATCKTCAGALGTDCKLCDNEAATTELERRRQLVAEWRQARKTAVDDVVDQKRKTPALHLRTPHCELTCTLKPLTVDRKKLDTHALMHLYGQRIESLRAMFVEQFELEDKDLPATLQVFLFESQKDHALMSPRATGIGSNGNRIKLMGVPAVLCMYRDRRDAKDDAALHRQVVHHVTHLLLGNMQPSHWLGNRKHGWVDAGVAHWFEDRITQRCANFCYDEILLKPGAGFKGGKWRPPVRKLVTTKKAISFAELSTRNTDQLSFEEHAMAFAYVDFLLTVHGGAKFRDFVRRLKKGDTSREGLKAIYGLSPLTVDPKFHAWVRAEYPPR
ncbi:MAG: hypothetical protein NXI31_03905 [bacterium]|nr:hypothetical protein [bacterium]